MLEKQPTACCCLISANLLYNVQPGLQSPDQNNSVPKVIINNGILPKPTMWTEALSCANTACLTSPHNGNYGLKLLKKKTKYSTCHVKSKNGCAGWLWGEKKGYQTNPNQTPPDQHKTMVFTFSHKIASWWWENMCVLWSLYLGLSSAIEDDDF